MRRSGHNHNHHNHNHRDVHHRPAGSESPASVAAAAAGEASTPLLTQHPHVVPHAIGAQPAGDAAPADPLSPFVLTLQQAVPISASQRRRFFEQDANPSSDSFVSSTAINASSDMLLGARAARAPMASPARASQALLQRHITQTALLPDHGQDLRLLPFERSDTLHTDTESELPSNGSGSRRLPRGNSHRASHANLNNPDSHNPNANRWGSHEFVSRSSLTQPEIYTTLDPDAPEVAAVKASSASTNSVRAIMSRLFKSAVSRSVVSYADVRHVYRIQHEQGREAPTTASGVFSQLILLIFNLTSIHKLFARIVSSYRMFTFLITADFIIGVISALLYLVEIQLNSDSAKNEIHGREPAWIWTERSRSVFHVLVGLASVDIASTLLRISFSDNRYVATLSAETIIVFIVSLPMLVLSRVQDGHLIYLPYFLRAIILIPQLKKVLRLRGYVPFVNFGAYREKLIVLTMTMLVIIFLGMCSFHLFETRFPSNQPISSSNLSLTQLLYYIVITVSTVGYGDITPKTVAGQLVVVVMILVSIIVIPGLVTDVQETFKLQQSGAGSYTRGSRKYIVVCGVFDTVARVETVLSMIFSKKATSKTKIILLARNKQSVHVKALLNQSHFRGRVVYLQGSGLDLEDLKRVQLKYADAAFILADTNAVNKKEEDEHNTLRAWAFDDYAPMTPLYVDNLLPGTEVLQDRTTSGSVCIDDLKQILLAYNCLYRGVGTLMVNLLRPCPLHGDYEDLWRAQYADGLANEIHQSDLNPAFAAYPFTAISYYVFKEFQVILFGVGVKTMSKNHAEVLHVLLNPGGTYVLKPSDTCLYMAQSEDDVRAINNLTRDEFERTMMQHSFSMAIHGSLARRPSAEDLANTPFQDSLMAEIYVKGYPTSINHDDWTPLCWLLAEPQCLEQVAIADAGFLQSHILVCTYTYTIFRFVCTLRSANLTAKELKPIVFLCPRLPTDEEFELLARFPQLYFVVGDATVQRDLERGNVHGSGKVVIINMQRSTSSSSSMDDFSDSSAIMVAHLIHNMFHRSGLRKYVVIHLHKRTNIKFLRPTARKRAHKRKVSALRRPTSSDLQHDWQDDVFFAPVFAAGRALSTSMIEPVLFHTYTNPFILDIFNAFCGVQYKKNQDMHDQLGIDRAGLCYVTVPPEFVHLPFGKLYENLACSVGVIPIGLLREEVDQAGLGNKLPFIVANPPFSLLLKETDLVYVLASPKQVL